MARCRTCLARSRSVRILSRPIRRTRIWSGNWVLNFQAGRFEAAESALRKVLHLAPDQARSYEGLAELFLQSGRWDDEAVRLAREAVRLNPAARNYVLLGRLCAMSGDFDAARLALDEALEREPDNGFYRQLREELPALERGRRAKQK